ncbi:MAG: hypothetical protein IJP39_06880 [Bacteroidales bacterium]|nr:hypothetical protein [Bacteroidales bacterium]MBQ6822121.1 hypothetical protein [Bacteroidales bacterium]MBR0083420.1 hypothetical protein [Bacteroidales bacterium]MBR0292234.1 hypothetical protein [Bacteroidales bacterium]
MKQFLKPLVIAVLAAGCSGGGKMAELQRIEGFLQDDPAGARSELRSIDKNTLGRAEEKALYSLLLSAAEDKCYNDIKADSLIAPAVAYYKRHGDGYHKFLTYYYLGRVYENAEDYGAATDALVKAEDYAEDAPGEYRTRLYVAKERVYLHQFAKDKALESVLKAKEISKDLDNPAFYLSNCYDVLALLTIQEEHGRARQELKELDTWMQERGLQKNADYFRTALRTELSSPEKDSATVRRLTESYLNKCASDGVQINPVLAADAYIFFGDFATAGAYMKGQENGISPTLFEAARKYITLAQIEEGLGHYKKALEYRAKQREVFDTINMSVFNNDVRFIEERYKSELEQSRLRQERMLLSLAVFLLGAGLAWGIVYYTRRKKEYETSVHEARAEYAFLKDIAGREGEGGRFTELITKRIQALRPYISGKGNLRFMARKDIEHINEARKETLRSLFLFYAITYPDFIRELADKGLSSEEAGLCVLYLLGYSLKEMNDFLSAPSIHQINISIRKKMDLPPNGAKLKTVLKEIFDRHYPEA